MSIVYILAAAFGIGLLIFIHELGHFIAARQIGARVEVFSLGFGPRVWGFQRGHTDYRLSLVPVGGYVQVAGQDPGDQRYPPDQCLYSKSVGARLWFFSGGVIMNLLFALVAFPIVFAVGVEFTAPRIGDVVSGGAAWQAGLRSGDRVLTLNDKPMYSFTNMEVEAALGGESVRLQVRRGDEEFEVEAHPEYDPRRGLRSLGVIGPLAQEYHPIVVEEGGAADAAGLRSGDLLLSIAGRDAFGEDVGKALAEIPGVLGANATPTPVEVVVERDGQRITAAVQPRVEDSGAPRIGVYQVLRRITAIREGAPAEWDLAVDDVVLSVDGEPFFGSYDETLETVLMRGSGPIRASVERNGATLELPPADASFRATLGAALALGAEERSIRIRPQPLSPAVVAGIVAGAEVLGVDGEVVPDFVTFAERVGAAAESTMELTVRLPGSAGPETVALTPSTLIADPGFRVDSKEGLEVYQKDGFTEAIKAGGVASMDLIKQLYVTLKKLITGDVDAKNLGGIITISRVSYRVAQWGPARFFYFLALLSLNLAFINILPIPVLDGGHVLFLFIEKIKGSPVSPRVFGYSQVLGLIFVLALLLFVTYNDIRRIIG